jgi:Tol biopolymer transport system component
VVLSFTAESFSAAGGDEEPSYSPQGDKIAFTRYPADFSTSSIVTMNPDRSGQTTIQPDAFFPRWGPAG